MIKKLRIRIKEGLKSYTQVFPVPADAKLTLDHSDKFLSDKVSEFLASVQIVQPKEVQISVDYLW